jgi:hypothetical protein
MNLFSSCDSAEITGRLQLSRGTRLALPIDVGQRKYRPGAVIPREPWRAATVADLATHFDADDRWQRHGSIAFATLPAAERRALEQLRLASLPAADANDHRLVARLSQACLEIIADYFRCSPGTRCYGVGVNGPDMLTTSIDRNIDRIVGLHVDHWDQLPLTVRATANNRLAVNVGDSTYYFMVVPTTLETMARRLDLPFSDAVDLNVLPNHFMAAFPELPVWRLEIAPGDVYIAPTDNVIHDGSTSGVTTSSRQLVFRGVIEPSELAYRTLFRPQAGTTAR